MGRVRLPAQSYTQKSESITGDELINLYAELNPEGSKYPYSLYNTPGLVEWADLGTGRAIQGMQQMGDNLYAVSANTLYKIDSSGTVTTIGSISGTAGTVELANNGTELVILNPDGNAWEATSSSITQITDGDFPTASSLTYLDGYHIVSVDGTDQFNISALLDPTNWDALDFASAEEKPDKLVKMFAYNSALWAFGEESYEVFYNSGNADFPFEQIPGASNTKRGCAAKLSVAEDDNTLIFLGNDRIVYRIEGYSPVRISTYAVEADMQLYTTVSDAEAFIYTQNGHKFYVINFPTENKTWVMDQSNGMWHKRNNFNNGGRWRAANHAFFAGLNLVGHNANGKIYKLDLDTYTDDGETIERVLEGTVFFVEAKRVIWDEIELDIDSGVGLVTGQGSDPQVMMSYSDDGGKSWSSERWKSFGKIGEYMKRVVWRRNGTARERIYRFRITDPVKVNIHGAYANVRLGRR